MATPDQIPSNLTLEIDDRLSPDEFIAAARAFFGYVKDIAETLMPPGEHIEWTARVKEGSYLIGIDPSQSAPADILRGVYARAGSSVRLLANGGEVENAELSDSALKHLRTLSDMSSPSGTRRRPLRIWVERKPIAIDESIARKIADDWRTAYSDYGVMEGRLDTIQDRGKLEFQVRDPALPQTVKCFVPEEMLQTAFQYFRKRVEVSGTVHYRRNGAPVSIDVEQIERLPEDSELPSALDVRGILA